MMLKRPMAEGTPMVTRYVSEKRDGHSSRAAARDVGSGPLPSVQMRPSLRRVRLRCASLLASALPYSAVRMYLALANLLLPGGLRLPRPKASLLRFSVRLMRCGPSFPRPARGGCSVHPTILITKLPRPCDGKRCRVNILPPAATTAAPAH